MCAQSTYTNIRQFTVLQWVESLNDGYERYAGVIQPATLSNMTYHIVDSWAFPQYLNERFDSFQFRHPYDKDAIDTIKNLLNTTLSNNTGGQRRYLGTEKIEKTETNHVAVREDIEPRHSAVTRYYLNKSGKDFIEAMDDQFETVSQIIERRGWDVDWQSIKYPTRENRSWSLRERDLPPSTDIQYLSDLQ